MLIILAVQILNLGVYGGSDCKLFASDSPARFSAGLNEIDSLIEYVVEFVWLHRDVFKENTQHNDSKSHNIILKTNALSYSIPEAFAEMTHYRVISNSSHVLWKEQFYYEYLNEINPPPPKVLS